MNQPDNNTDARLDALLGARTLRAPDSFADRTLARLRAAEQAADERLDALVSAHPVTASTTFTEQTLTRLASAPVDERLDELAATQPLTTAPDFTEKTMARIQQDSAPSHRQRWMASVAGLAAALVITFATVGPKHDPLLNSGKPVVVDSAFVPDAATDHALALAGSLSEAAMLLDDESMELLNVLSADQPGI